MTIATAEQVLIEKVKQHHDEGLRVEEKVGKRPSFFIAGTRVGIGEPGERQVRVMKRVSQTSNRMRDDFDQLVNESSITADPVVLEALAAYRRELMAIIPKAKRQLVGEPQNKDLPKGSVERELKTAVHFEVVDAASHVDEVVAAMIRLAQALRK